MRKFIVILIVVLMGCFYALWDLSSAPPGKVVKAESASVQFNKAPDVTMTDIAGNDFRLYDFEGKTVVLNIWATWCTPCVKEMPDLLELANRHKHDLVFIALSTDRDVETIERFFKKLPEDVQDIIDADNVIFAHDPRLEISKGEFGTNMYPESFIIDKDMNIIKKISGVIDWLGEDARQMIFQAGDVK